MEIGVWGLVYFIVLASITTVASVGSFIMLVFMSTKKK